MTTTLRIASLTAIGLVAGALPAHGASIAAPPLAGLDLEKAGVILALLLSELLPFMPVRAKGVLHGAMLFVRALVANLS